MRENESRSEKRSHPNELSENWRNRDVPWGGRLAKEGQLAELLGDQNSSPVAPPRRKRR